MLKTSFIIPCLFVLGSVAFAQDAPATPPASVPAQSETKPANQTPPIKVNILNVCTPAESEKQEIAAALKKIPAKAVFAPDFEVTRGRASMPDSDPAKYIRLRRELTGDPVFNIVQYSLSADPKNTQETLIFKAKDPKDLLLISIEDSISASAAAPGTVLETDTPASHIKLERFGKSSVALARCAGADQSAYENLFTAASKAIASYRKSLGLRSMFRSEVSWLNAAASNEKQAKPRASKPEKQAEVAKPPAPAEPKR